VIFKNVYSSYLSRNPPTGLDSLVIASQEGITLLSYEEGRWSKRTLGKGEQDPKFKGSGEVDIGRIGSDAYSYIATVEPAHGKAVAIYK
jgi:hypothetical protein